MKTPLTTITMGYYIETDSLKNKAQWIRDNCWHADLTDKPDTVDTGLVPVCVVDNGPFEAAAIAFDPREAEAFVRNPSDTRPKQWLLIRIEDAERLNPKVKGHINWSTP